jgi:HPt (histidine-containing phosphotransfer) domain-containing protein
MKHGIQPTMLFDRATALERIGGDEELLKEIAGIFLLEFPALIQDIHNALANGDPDALERSAHSLKGSVANFEARPAVEAAMKLEALGRAGRLDSAEAALSELEAILEALQPELEQLRDE